jgi:hypothetical protein
VLMSRRRQYCRRLCGDAARRVLSCFATQPSCAGGGTQTHAPMSKRLRTVADVRSLEEATARKGRDVAGVCVSGWPAVGGCRLL